MNTKALIATTRPWCPKCPHGYMFLMSVELETCPEVEPDVAMLYQCRQCGYEMEIYISEMSEANETFVSTTYIHKLYEKRTGLKVTK